MDKGRYIDVNIESSKDGLLVASLSCSKDIQKYLRSRMFFVKYESDISNVSTSILYIPVVSNVVTFAWAMGADVYVDELDQSFLESLNNIRRVMKRWYPFLPFSTHINVGKVTPNKEKYDGYGLLFSGGLDSTTSYISHRAKKPSLIMVWGADIPLDEVDFWGEVRSRYENFRDQEGLELNFVKTNMHLLRESMLGFRFGRYLSDSSWWGAIQHGVGLLGLCAPLTVTEHIGTIFIASSHTGELLSYRWGSHPLIDNKVSWGNVRVIHDGYQFSRHEKIKYVLKDYIETTGQYPLLRVCHSQFNDLNCGRCEKCSRTIAGLVLENIDPERCGFDINNGFFDSLKRNLIDRRFVLSPGRVFLWKDMQKYIPEEMSHNLYNCEEFFKWLKGFEISEVKRGDLGIKSYLSYLFHQMPRNMQIAVLLLLNSRLVSGRISR